METLLHFLANHGVISAAQYWHLRLLSAIALGPLLAVLYLLFFDRPARRAAPGMWVSRDGRLLVVR